MIPRSDFLRVAFAASILWLAGCDSVPTLDGEASVKPGINEKFLSSELDVDAFVRRFELESREVYVLRNEIVDATGVQSGSVVADIGAGTGLFTRMFARRVGDAGRVYSVEIAQRFLDHIERETRRARLRNVSFVLCDENDVCLPEASVDIAFVCDTYHHFEYPKATLASIHRALRPDGRLVVLDFERIPGESREWVLGHVRAGKSVVLRELEAAGFALEREVDVGLRENYLVVLRKRGVDPGSR